MTWHEHGRALMLQVALLAIGAARAAFQVLRDTSTAADIDSQLREALEPRAGAEPLPPDPPRLLPAVYVLWAPLVTALRVSLLKPAASPCCCCELLRCRERAASRLCDAKHRK